MQYPQEMVKGGLVVRMFGGFSVTYEGREVALGRNTSAKFIQLLQLVWLQGQKGLSKEKLVEELYDREEITNINSSFNTLVYRMRHQMRSAGLPEADYVVRRKGLYIPDETIPVWTDALEFEKLIEKAEQAADDVERCRYYTEAFNLYQGDLLPDIVNELWVYEKGVKYKRLFSNCVQWLGEYAKQGRDYKTMEMVYNKAAKLYPLEEWEAGLLEALIANGQFKKAHELYNKSVRLYSDELGLPPPARMLECYKRMSEKLVHYPGTLEEIHAMLREPVGEDGLITGAYYCSYPSFIDAYRLLSRNMERSGVSMYLMMCTLVDYEGKTLQNEIKLKTRSDALRRAIQKCLRQGDAFTKYSASQYLILLVNIRREDCELIFRRIHGRLRNMTSPQAELRYQVKTVAQMA